MDINGTPNSVDAEQASLESDDDSESTCSYTSTESSSTETESDDESSVIHSSTASNTDSETESSSDSDVDTGSSAEPTVYGSKTLHFSGLSQYDTPLFDGTEVTILDSYLLLYQFALRHGLTKLAFQELIDLVSVHLPKTRITTVYKLQKFFVEHFRTVQPTSKKYCRKCHHLLKDSESACVNGCDGEISQFVYIPVEGQIRRILEGI